MLSSGSSPNSHGMTDVAPGSEGGALDAALADLLDLSLLAKQAHWNVVGPRFGPMHLLFDELADLARTSADSVAERAVTLGYSPDGRATAILRLSSLPSLERGSLRDTDTIVTFLAILEVVVNRIHSGLDSFSEDRVTVDLFTRIVGQLERQAWILRAYRDL